MNQLEAFLRIYGLWALFFAAAIEGDLTLLLAGMLVHLRIWPAMEAWAVGAFGGLVGDSFYFWLGHGTARRWLTTAHGQRVMPHFERAAKRYGVRSLFFARYIYGARMATMFFWGMQRLPYQRLLGAGCPQLPDLGDGLWRLRLPVFFHPGELARKAPARAVLVADRNRCVCRPAGTALLAGRDHAHPRGGRQAKRQHVMSAVKLPRLLLPSARTIMATCGRPCLSQPLAARL